MGQPPADALGSDVFISYSRADRDFVAELNQGLEARGRSVWVDWQDIPPTAEWMAEIRMAIDKADAIVFVLSPNSAASAVCAQEIEHAFASNKRIVPVRACEVAPDRLPETIVRLNWILADEIGTDAAAEAIVGAIDTDLERLRAHARLLVRAREWASGEDRALLLRGSELVHAEGLVSSAGEPRPTPDQTRLVMASRRAATGRQRRSIALVTAAFIVSAALGVFGWTQRGAALRQKDRAEQQTAVARSQGLAAEAVTNMDDQIDLSALLALEAERTAPTTESVQAMHAVAQATPWVRYVLRGHTQPVFAVAFDPAGDRLASGSLDGTVVLWDLTTGRQIGAPLQANKFVQSMAFSPDGRLLASGGDRHVLFWDPDAGTQIGVPMDFDQATYGLTFSPDGRTLAVGSGPHINLIDVASRTLQRPPINTHVALWDMAFAPDGKSIASSGADGTVRIFSVASGKPVLPPLKGTGGIMSKVAFSPDGRTVAGAARGQVRFWDTATGESSGKMLRLDASGDVRGLAYSPDGSTLATADSNRGVELWDARSRTPIGARFEGQVGAPDSLAFSLDGRTLASGSDSGNVVVWAPRALHHPHPFYGVFGEAFTAGSTLAAGDGTDGSVEVWDASSGELLRTLAHPASYVNEVASSPDGRFVAAGYGDGTVAVWDASSGRPVGPGLTGLGKGEVSVAFSPDGSMLATGAKDRTVRIFDTSTWAPVGQPMVGHSSLVQRVAFSPDGRMVASSGKDGKIILWDPEAQTRIGNVMSSPHPGDVTGLAFSPDGRLLATGFTDGSIRLWEPSTQTMAGVPLVGQSTFVTDLAFSPDGSVLASGSQDGYIVLWDMATRRPIGDPLPAYGAVWGLAFSPDGNLLASGGDMGSSYVRDRTAWSSDLGLLQQRLCTVAGRNLTREEWAQFLSSEPYGRTCPQWPVP